MGKQNNENEEKRITVTEAELQNLVNSILQSIGVNRKIDLDLDLSGLAPPVEEGIEDELDDYDDDFTDTAIQGDAAQLISNMTVGDLLGALSDQANDVASDDLTIVESSYDEKTQLYSINGKYYREGALIMGPVQGGTEVMVNLFPEALATGGIGKPLDVTHYHVNEDTEGIFMLELDYARAQKKALESGEVCWAAVCRLGHLFIFCNTFYNKTTLESEHLIKLFNCVPCQDNSVRAYCAATFEIDDFLDMIVLRKLKGYSVDWHKVVERQDFLASKGELEDPGSLDVDVKNAFYEVTPQVKLPDAIEEMHPEVYDAYHYKEEPCDDEVLPGSDNELGGCVGTDAGMAIETSGQQDSSSASKKRRSKPKVSGKTSTKTKQSSSQETQTKNGKNNDS